MTSQESTTGLASTLGSERLAAAIPTVRRLALICAVTLVVLLTFYKLPHYPATWFDEGSHLHVPKALVLYGVYADYSSEGFRYYGPSIGVGPTVLLPIAAIFRVLGIGLLQARLVMAVYLLAAVWAFYSLADMLGGKRVAWVATALMFTSRSVYILYFGRQVLGEVPALAFLAGGLLAWMSAWHRPTPWRLVAGGLLLGLSAVTKSQFLLAIGPTLLGAWLLNAVYYRRLPHRAFLITGTVTASMWTAWQAYLLLFLGPGEASSNLALLRESASAAAAVFSPTLMKESLKELLGLKTYLGALVPAMGYGLWRCAKRDIDGQRWGAVMLLVLVNLTWYVFASVGWIRYAFPGLVLVSIPLAAFLLDMMRGLLGALQQHGRQSAASLVGALMHDRTVPVGVAAVVWSAAMVAMPLAQTSWEIISTAGPGEACAMADYLEEHVPHTALIETWQPELGFLTDHRYHYPPPEHLGTAIRHVFLDGRAPAPDYRFVAEERPDYVLVGAFSNWFAMYPPEVLEDYEVVAEIGAYTLYQRSG